MQFSEFSKTFSPDNGVLQLMEDLGEALESRSETMMLGGGNPAFIPQMQRHFRREMQALLDQGDEFEKVIGNYGGPQGQQGFIDQLAEMLQHEYGWPITRHNIAVCNGSQSSFSTLFRLFSGAFHDGSVRKILLPITPEYIGYNDTIDPDLFESKRPEIRDDPEDRLFYKYAVNFKGLDVDRRYGALCVSRPTNPTGNVITDEELGRLNERAEAAGIPFIIDGAYGLPFPGILFADATPFWSENTILCLSLSKLGLPGVRTGIVVANREVIEIVKGSNAVFSLAPGRIGPALVKRLVKSRELLALCRDVILPYYRNRVGETVSLVRETMGDLPIRIHKPEGGIFLWLWFPGCSIANTELYAKLKKRGVFVISGNHFFPGLNQPWQHTRECVRISYTAEWSQVKSGMEIIADEIRRAYDG
ncbi:MAG: valine--pyruvate transaminase [Gammaproteobacteria bacterium]|nr:valine--pyruvate transaminase [Gammaproteobacteria bacterium]MYD76372.1 valine--pyruvate transaminase [Gammaproteobacteria bacterium]MYJ52369.1 valine--pyruvate transaminase [Gammaproteobacteria bacterium]